MELPLAGKSTFDGTSSYESGYVSAVLPDGLTLPVKTFNTALAPP